ncbi:hypothetical protein HELRODRAFT_188358 [Helobdella robusta]|uniref:Ig-like domain-containing protein n=1 Tax=Helobdella robusta TaxID=6412 RepID=T1FPX1_HELRO|nr:hypothetical protein HELRODRAFT_188358 [Helobdella robusta]ESO06426.1 hypothetical protein HELRODRAFT_188358 [Helobdella robusta]
MGVIGMVRFMLFAILFCCVKKISLVSSFRNKHMNGKTEYNLNLMSAMNDNSARFHTKFRCLLYINNNNIIASGNNDVKNNFNNVNNNINKNTDNECMLSCESTLTAQQTSNKKENHSTCSQHISKLNHLKISNLLTKQISIESFMKEIFLSKQVEALDVGSERQFNITSVQLLDLSDNNVETVANDDLHNFTNLIFLNFSNNNLKFLEQKCFDNLIYLNYLDLSKNRLYSLPEDLFSNLLNLIMLNLSSNELNNFSFSRLLSSKKLKRLDLSSNNLTRLEPNKSTETINIEHLNLSHNRLQTIPPIISTSLKQLKKLFLNDNPIEEISKHSFLSLANLLEVELTNMRHLRSVEDESFRNLSKLQVLNISFNPHLNYFDGNSVMHSPNLARIDLQQNDLHFLSANIVSALPSLQTINLSGNPILKSCNNRWIVSCHQCYLDQLVHDNLQQPAYNVNNDSSSNNKSINTSSKNLYNNLNGTRICQPDIIPLYEKYFHLAVGDPLRLKCRSVSFEAVNVFWSFIGLGSRYHMHHDHSELDDLHVEQNKSTISVDHVAFYHAGLYICNAQTKFGKQTSNVTVRIYNPNASIYFTSYSRTSVTVEWAGTETTMKTTEYYISCRRLIDPHLLFQPIHQHDKNSLEASFWLAANETSVHPTLFHHPTYQHRMPPFTNGEAASLSFIKIKIGPFMRRNTFNGLSPLTPYEICLYVSNSTDRRFSNNQNEKFSANANHYFKSSNDNFYSYDSEETLIILSCFNFTTLDQSTGGYEYEPGIRRLPILQILLGTFGCLAFLIIFYAICNSLLTTYCSRLVGSARSNKQNINNVYRLITRRSERRNSLTLVPVETTFIENSRASSRTSLIS